MSLILIKSPIYNDGGTISNSIAAKSQIFFSVQRNDLSGGFFNVTSNGGKAQFEFSTAPNGLVVGDRFFVEHERGVYFGPAETRNPTIQAEPGFATYRGEHQITQVIDPLNVVTSTDFIDTDNTGYLTFQNWDFYTVTALCQASTAVFQDVIIDYKIPYNNPWFNFNLKEAFLPIFGLTQDNYAEVSATITATRGDGLPEGGTAVQTYDLQLFNSYVPFGREYGANLVGFLPRPLILGKFLTKFELPRAYEGVPITLQWYADSLDQVYIVGQQLDVNGNITSPPTTDGYIPEEVGFQRRSYTPLFIEPETKYFEFWLSSDINGTIPLTETLRYQLDCFKIGTIQMLWVNDLGGWETIFMDTTKLSSAIQGEPGITYKTGEVTDWEVGSTGVEQLRGTRIQRYSIAQAGLERRDLWAMQTITTARFVGVINTLSAGGFDLLSNTAQVLVVDGFTTSYNVGQYKNYDFSAVIELPDDSQLLEDLIGYSI